MIDTESILGAWAKDLEQNQMSPGHNLFFPEASPCFVWESEGVVRPMAEPQTLLPKLQDYVGRDKGWAKRTQSDDFL